MSYAEVYLREAAAVTHRSLDLLAQVTDTQHNLGHTLLRQQRQLPMNERPAGHRQQRFRYLLCQRPQPRGQAACKYRDR